MNDTPGVSPRSSSARPTMALALASVGLWWLVLAVWCPDQIADEGPHLVAVYHFAAGNWGCPTYLPMFPTYHVIAAQVVKVLEQSFGGDRLLVLRTLNVCLAVAAILVMGAAARVWRPQGPSDTLLHFAWLPILFPFLPLAYTEPAALLCLTAALYLHLRRRFVLSAGTLLLACMLRQSMVVWVIFMAVWALVDLSRETRVDVARGSGPPGGALIRQAAGRVWGHGAILVLAGVVFVAYGGFSPVAVEANRIRINVAQFYLLALFVMALWAPIWLGRFGADWRRICNWARNRPGLGIVGLLMILALGVALVLGFQNPHPWNNTANFLRNWPLMAMGESLVFRTAVVICLAAVVPVMVRFTWQQEGRLMLALVWAFTLLYLLPHSLAEPRYFIITFMLVNFLTSYTSRQARQLSIWYGLISGGVAVYVMRNGFIHGGIW